jgi:hypothetical protein
MERPMNTRSFRLIAGGALVAAALVMPLAAAHADHRGWGWHHRGWYGHHWRGGWYARPYVYQPRPYYYAPPPVYYYPPTYYYRYGW